ASGTPSAPCPPSRATGASARRTAGGSPGPVPPRRPNASAGRSSSWPAPPSSATWPRPSRRTPSARLPPPGSSTPGTPPIPPARIRAPGAPADPARPARVGTPDGVLTADLVVAADGVRSGVRSALFPAHPGPVYAGFTTWRVLIPVPGAEFSSHETWGRGRIWGTHPLRDGRVYAYAAARTP